MIFLGNKKLGARLQLDFNDDFSGLPACNVCRNLTTLGLGLVQLKPHSVSLLALCARRSLRLTHVTGLLRRHQPWRAQHADSASRVNCYFAQDPRVRSPSAMEVLPFPKRYSDSELIVLIWV